MHVGNNCYIWSLDNVIHWNCFTIWRHYVQVDQIEKCKLYFQKFYINKQKQQQKIRFSYGNFKLIWRMHFNIFQLCDKW